MACYLVLIKNGKILLSRRANTGYQDGKYSMVAGHLENNETVYSATIREAKEEAGLVLHEEGLKIVHVMHRQDVDREYIDFFVSSKTKEEPRNLEPKKCDQLSWFEIDNLPDSTISYIRLAIEKIKEGIIYSEYKVG